MTKETIDKILGELAKVDQIIRKFRANNTVPEIEKDILLTKLRTIYESILLSQLEINTKIDLISEASDTKDTYDPKSITETLSQKKGMVAEKDIKIEEPRTKAVSDIPEQKTDETPVNKAGQSTKIQHPHSVKPGILADKFEQKSFLNEALAQYKNMFDIARKMQNRPLHDLFSAINLNDKFLFIKELFNDDATLYQKTIEKLNTSANFNESVQFLDQHFTWDFEDEQVQKLLELVRRRHIPANEA
jgi:hypothetical protein